MSTTEVMDTELMDLLDAQTERFGLTMYGGQFHVEHQGGRIGPFFSARGALLGFQEARNAVAFPLTAVPRSDFFNECGA